MDTVRFASAAENGLLTTHLVPSCAYKNVADAPSTVSPAPSAAALSAAPFATVIFKFLGKYTTKEQDKTHQHFHIQI